MAAKLQPYPKYNPVAYDYVNSLPDGWKLLPNIAIFEERIERGHDHEELLSVTIKRGVIKQTEVEIKKDNSNEDKSKYKLVKVGDIAYNKMRMWQGALGYSSYQGIASPAYVILKPKMEINPRYFHYIFRTGFYTNYSKRFSYGIVDDQLSLRYTDFKRMYSIVPPLSIQNAIVDYLDEKCEEIDKFIGNKEHIISLLEDKKKRIIDQCITSGLDKGIDFKEELSVLPSYPSHWKVKRIKHLFSIFNGYAFSTDSFVPNGVQVIKIGNLYQNKLSLDRQPTFVEHKYLATHKQFVIKKGDILMSLTGTMGKRDYGYAVQIETEEEFLLNQRVAKLIPNKSLNKYYALFLLRSEMFLNQLYLKPSGTKQANLSNDDIMSIYVVIPALIEQEKIVKFIQEEFEEIDRTIANTGEEIKKILEFKEALVNKIITGKLSPFATN